MDSSGLCIPVSYHSQAKHKLHWRGAKEHTVALHFYSSLFPRGFSRSGGGAVVQWVGLLSLSHTL